MKRSLMVLSLLLPFTAGAQQPQPAAQPAPRSAAAPATPAAAPAAARPGTPTQQLTPAQQAQLDKQNAEMSAAALQAVRLVDGGQAAQLWDGASSVARKAVARDAFAKQVAADRARLGALVGRGQPSISRVRFNAGAAVPEGLYLNVTYPTRFEKSAQPVRELVSFRLDEDRVWRLAGYSVRAPGT
ncbi:MAG: DUF4019 domain-containing protein [Stenotrophomonas sp.]|uniref:DUF4019 domain-containing protein n=1 Tax=Stenotrophomonas sp. TaxID=69392 RepID=UPI0029BB4A70|nr:DUF4019 domain-containing protein [Stenotrophomonas sp.]MDX3930351.1 DUF4019 domain-containing protein [Stenotrophomonas sp.]